MEVSRRNHQVTASIFTLLCIVWLWSPCSLQAEKRKPNLECTSFSDSNAPTCPDHFSCCQGKCRPKRSLSECKLLASPCETVFREKSGCCITTPKPKGARCRIHGSTSKNSSTGQCDAFGKCIASASTSSSQNESRPMIMAASDDMSSSCTGEGWELCEGYWLPRDIENDQDGDTSERRLACCNTAIGDHCNVDEDGRPVCESTHCQGEGVYTCSLTACCSFGEECCAATELQDARCEVCPAGETLCQSCVTSDEANDAEPYRLPSRIMICCKSNEDCFERRDGTKTCIPKTTTTTTSTTTTSSTSTTISSPTKTPSSTPSRTSTPTPTPTPTISPTPTSTKTPTPTASRTATRSSTPTH